MFVLASLVIAGTSSAQTTIERTGPNGGTDLSVRSIEDGGYTNDYAFTGPNGGTVDRTTICTSGICVTERDATNRNGISRSQTRETVKTARGSRTQVIRDNGRICARCRRQGVICCA